MDSKHPLAVVILAAGKGTRMKSSRAKVLHHVFYRPMLHHVLDAVAPLGAQKTIVIVGHQKEDVERSLEGYDAICCEQRVQNGTGHAVLCTRPLLADFSGTVMILCGDSPLLLPEHLQEMVHRHISGSAGDSPLSIMTTRLADPTNYGRIISDAGGAVLGVVEEKDCSPEQRTIQEINGGIYCAERQFLFAALDHVTTDNSQGEMYLTDIVAIAVQRGFRVQKYEHPQPAHVLGVNSKVELAQAHREIQRRRNLELMGAGVTMLEPDSTAVAPPVIIGADCSLAGRVSILGRTTIGDSCVIEPGVFISNSTIGSGVHIGANSVLLDSVVDGEEVLAPLTLLRGGPREKS
jgi:bifunctional UDP-N-acetylglucosamine pyrophosphorylase/glucosamine-1-phosphate N-acetyltransferase